VFIKKDNGPRRSIGHFVLHWSDSLWQQVTSGSACSNPPTPCDTQGYVKHLGRKFSATDGLPITPNPDTVGPIGGFGWLLKLNGGAPRNLVIKEIEVDPGSILLLSVAYPTNAVLTVSAEQEWCWETSQYSCRVEFHSVASIDLVRTSTGNAYHVDASGVLTFRVFQQAYLYAGNPNFFFPTYSTPSRDGLSFAVPRFSWEGVTLQQATGGSFIQVSAVCDGTGDYCSGAVANHDPDVCASGYEQLAYDKCCLIGHPNTCTFADGTTTTGLPP